MLPLKWAGFDKYTLSNKMENSMPVLYLQICHLSAVCWSRQSSSAWNLKKIMYTSIYICMEKHENEMQMQHL